MSASSLPADLTGSRVARNTLFNIVGQLLPLLVGIAAIPVTVRALGEARFGLLGLAWAILGSVGLLDLGLGRATTKFVAEYLAAGDAVRLRRVATLSVASQTALGALGGIALALLGPWLVERGLGVPPGLHREARGALLALALSVPFVVLSASLRGILEAAQRFDLVNLIRTPTSAAVLVVPAVAAALGAHLPAIVLLLLLVRIAACLVTAALIPRAIPGFRWTLEPGWEALRPLLGYGGWVSVSNVVSPLLLYLERFVLGSVAGVAAVAYYTAPYEALTRVLVVPVSLTSVLLPAFSAASAAQPGLYFERFVARSLRYLLLGLSAPLFVVVGFSRELVGLWLGGRYADDSTAVVQILAVGVLVNSLAQVPYVYLLGRGRPDLPAKFHLLELPLYAMATWALIGAFGVGGAALAWALRVTLDAILLCVASARIAQVSSRRLFGERGGRAWVAVGMFALVAVGVAVAGKGSVDVRLAVLAGAAIAFGVGVWRLVLDEVERAALRALAVRLLRRNDSI